VIVTALETIRPLSQSPFGHTRNWVLRPRYLPFSQVVAELDLAFLEKYCISVPGSPTLLHVQRNQKQLSF
jgi:hypothetical protein